MEKDWIEVGDTVNIHFTNSSIYDLEVLYVPCATGDCWHLKDLKTGTIYYVQNFCYISKHVSKG